MYIFQTCLAGCLRSHRPDVPELALPTPFGQALTACLESVKDGDAKEFAGDIGKTLRVERD